MQPDIERLPAQMRVAAGQQSLEDMLRVLGPFMPKPDIQWPQPSSQWKLADKVSGQAESAPAAVRNIY